MSKPSEVIVQRVPFWLAVATTVLISLPFGTLLGKYNLALWVSFIAWAEYFALGAKPSALKLIWVPFPLGALTMAIFATINNYFVVYAGWDPLTSVAIWIFIWVAIAVYIMRFHPLLQQGSLPYFNGLSMFLALYFAGVQPGQGAGPLVGNPLIDPWILWLWCTLAGIFGGILGLINVALTFPKKVKE
ncbi:MAG: hypothetical protein B7O98_00145 [Zestosphaera tikiterensis]|uniref:DUF1097 domain-containing protein n=1 Tax=Zestosphaera tikiterensis TaxID=1973259 RepID=A0A2R7Y8L2_9CREN|nr:MAG: hypothetical protein B7O98_00145 [Zestosphaera tikiterensis]